MSSIAHRYADFSPLGIDGQLEDPVPLERVEDQKLQAFEEGYQAGWSDADKNYAAEQKTTGDEILNTLRDLSFTYQEAASRLNRGLKPLFDQIVTKLLPLTIDAAFQAQLIEQLAEMAQTQTKAQITLEVSADNMEMLEDLLDGRELDVPIAIISRDGLSSNQIFISLDPIEREINMDAVCQEITKAMNAFIFHNQLEQKNA